MLRFPEILLQFKNRLQTDEKKFPNPHSVPSNNILQSVNHAWAANLPSNLFLRNRSFHSRNDGTALPIPIISTKDPLKIKHIPLHKLNKKILFLVLKTKTPP